MVFVPDVKPWTSSTPSAGSTQGAWEFAQPVQMCFVDLEKAFDRLPRGILWGFSSLMGHRAPLSVGVHITGSKSDLFPLRVRLRQACPLSPILFITFMNIISRHVEGGPVW